MFFVLVTLIIGAVFIKFIEKILQKSFKKERFDVTLKNFIQKLIKTMLWIILIIIILSNLGFNVIGFVAGLGIMGFIICFATRDIFSNFAAGLMILIYKPFKLNDFVDLNGIKGVIKEINLSSCIIISETKEWVLIQNSRIWGNPIKKNSRKS